MSRTHLRFGWWTLLAFLSIGLVLEALHGFKVQAYMNVANETRRLLWTLAHAHGTLLALVNIAFAVTLSIMPTMRPKAAALGSRTLLAATLLLPLGFFLGGAFLVGRDPGLPVLLVPLGGLLLLVSVLAIALALRGKSEPDLDDAASEKQKRSKRELARTR